MELIHLYVYALKDIMVISVSLKINVRRTHAGTKEYVTGTTVISMSQRVLWKEMSWSSRQLLQTNQTPKFQFIYKSNAHKSMGVVFQQVSKIFIMIATTDGRENIVK